MKLSVTRHFHWTFVDPPPLMLFHIGRSEVNCLLDLMESEFSEPMLFERGTGTVQDETFDPAQVWGVHSIMPKVSVLVALQDVRSPDSSALGLASVYEYKRLVAYLRVNSRDKDRPLMPFRVSRHLYWSFLIELVICTHSKLVNGNDLAVSPHLGKSIVIQTMQVVICKEGSHSYWSKVSLTGCLYSTPKDPETACSMPSGGA